MEIIIVDENNERANHNKNLLVRYAADVHVFQHLSEADEVLKSDVAALIYSFPQQQEDSEIKMLQDLRVPVYVVGEMDARLVALINRLGLHVADFFYHSVIPEEMELHLMKEQRESGQLLFVHSDRQIYLGKTDGRIYELPAMFSRQFEGHHTFYIKTDRQQYPTHYAIPYSASTGSIVRPSSILDRQWDVLLITHLWQLRINCYPSSPGIMVALGIDEWVAREQIKHRLLQIKGHMGRIGERERRIRIGQAKATPMIAAAAMDCIVEDVYGDQFEFRYPIDKWMLIYYMGYSKSEWLLCTPSPYKALAHGKCPVDIESALLRAVLYSKTGLCKGIDEKTLRSLYRSSEDGAKRAYKETVSLFVKHLQRICKKIGRIPRILLTGEMAADLAAGLPKEIPVEVVSGGEYAVVQGMLKRNRMEVGEGGQIYLHSRA